MSPREEVVNALLPKLKELAPSAGVSDLSFFGGSADVSSPLTKKFGVDITPETVYNIKTTTVFRGLRLFSDVWEKGGFLNCDISGEVWELIADEAISRLADYDPDDTIDVSADPAFVRAGLLDAWHESAEEGGLPPADPVVRKAFRFCLMADTEARRSLALKAACEALSRSRRAKALGGSGLISKKAALAMASAFDKNNK